MIWTKIQIPDLNTTLAAQVIEEFDMDNRIKMSEVTEEELMEKIQRIIKKTGVKEDSLSNESKLLVNEARKRMNPIYERNRACLSM